MIRAYALYFALVIAFLIAVISSSIVLLGYYSSFTINESITKRKLEQNAFSATNLVLAETDFLPFNEEVSMDLYNTGEDSVRIKKSEWGMYGLAQIKTYSGNHEVNKMFLYGALPSGIMESAFYMVDNNRPLSFCGNSLIKGDAFIPKKGIEKAYIEGKNFVGSRPIEGKVMHSNIDLPGLASHNISRLKTIYAEGLNTRFKSFEELDSSFFRNSFADSTLEIVGKTIDLSGTTLKGNILVRANDMIVLDGNTALENVMLMAPYILIRSGFKGAVQVFARDSIVVEDHVELYYPSSLGLPGFGVVAMSKIHIGSDNRITGMVFTNSAIESSIEIGNNTVMEGVLFAGDALELRGDVWGSVICKDLTLQTKSSTYHNHLLDVKIDRGALSEHFVMGNLLGETDKRKIVAWLH